MAKKRKKPARRRTDSLAPVATAEETARFFRKLQRKFPAEPRSKRERERLRKYLAKVGKDRLQALMRRAVVSMVQPPQPVKRRRATGSRGRGQGRQRG
jgi:hypothetical protein